MRMRFSVHIRDNDCAYGAVFTRRVRSMGIRDRPIAPRSPWQNGYVERAIGSIQRECFDHMILWSEAHLRRVLKRKNASFFLLKLDPFVINRARQAARG
jgi:transposase InsO family protein